MIQLGSKIRVDAAQIETIAVPEEGVFIMREITDADGDGVEDNVYYKDHEYDKFYKPAVYGHIEHIHNTRNGELPGHHLKEDHPVPGRHASDLLRDNFVQMSDMDELADNFGAREPSFVQTHGPEKNQYYTDKELARFEKRVFGDEVEDFHNTQSGELPGHWRATEFPEPAWHPTELAHGRHNPELEKKAVVSISRAQAEAQAEIAEMQAKQQAENVQL